MVKEEPHSQYLKVPLTPLQRFLKEEGKSWCRLPSHMQILLMRMSLKNKTNIDQLLNNLERLNG
jgi:hypothetical protein